jgi:hypothetical protein
MDEHEWLAKRCEAHRTHLLADPERLHQLDLAILDS